MALAAEAQKVCRSVGRPYQLGAGFIFEAGISVMLELRSQSQEQGTSEPYLILHKRAKEVVGAMERIDRKA